MSGLGALVYADLRSLINAARDIRRSGARTTVWILGALLFGSWLAVRVLAPQRHRGTGPGALAQCDFVVCCAIAIFGIALAYGSRLAGLFANRAEGQWIIGSPLAPFAAVAYLQVRELVRRSPRMLITFGYLALIYLPNVVTGPELWRDLGYALLTLPAIGAIPLPRRLARGPLATACVAAGSACILVALVPLARDAALTFGIGGALGDALRALPAYHPGSVLLAPLGVANLALAAALLGIAAAAVLVLATAARDAYPELYAFSSEHLDRAERITWQRRTSAAAARVRAVSRHAERVPPGIGVFLWKAWVEYGRRTPARLTALETAGMLVGGYVLGRLTAGARPLGWVMLAPVALFPMLMATIGFGVSLDRELRRPIFWLSGASLFERLWGLLAGHTWRYVGWFLLVGIGLASAGARIVPVTLVALDGPAIFVLLAAVGYATCAVIPNEIDRRGPFAVLRMLLTYVLLLPVLIAGVATGIVERSLLGGAVACALAALLEAAVLIAFAAWRLDTGTPPP